MKYAVTMQFVLTRTYEVEARNVKEAEAMARSRFSVDPSNTQVPTTAHLVTVQVEQHQDEARTTKIPTTQGDRPGATRK